uniref:Sulfotransferase domain-containing protein n=1 Tax=Helicotheca tamesis TaxID=374047 RepID=A0A7S2H6D2_9STRA|mmetsp:Transcript_15609/g.21341  ORF Transcript_15609/g.21341 Transcript_15609/m.21341 type:complete len:341 (+) Transcript_15609:66-1088(+)
MHPSKRIKRVALLASLATIGFILLQESITSIDIARKTSLPDDVATDIEDVTDPLKSTDTAVFWHIPKDSGSSMKAYYACMGLVEASDMSQREGHDHDKNLQVWELNGHKFVNVDTTREDGMLRAKNLGLPESGLADVVFTMFPRAASKVFNPEHEGRLFAFFRHPVDRAVSLFYYRQVAEWEERLGVYRPDFAEMKIEDWILGEKSLDQETNFMVRMLINNHVDPITEADFENAKEILHAKVLVGLVSKMEESVNRFDTYFGWNENEKREECLDHWVRNGTNKNTHKKLREGSEAWKKLERMNDYDVRLYEYAVQLFEEQGRVFERSGKVGHKQTVSSTY